jgi:predicted acyl esterase
MMNQPLSEVRDGMRIEWDVAIEADDGTLLAADVFRPDDDLPHPILLAAGPYGKGLSFAEGYPHQWNSLVTEHPEVLVGSTGAYQVWEYPDPERWVPLGYVCVRVDTRGTGRSRGEVDFFSPRETQDLFDAVEWAGTQPWSNGRVGLLGISYLATNQWQVAELQPPHLSAICPWEGASDFYREYTHHGGITSEFLPSWMPYQVKTVQHGRGAGSPVNSVNGRSVTGPDALDEAELADKLIRIGEVLNEHPLRDEYYQQRTATLEKITVPVLSAANWGGIGLHSRGNFEGFVRAASEQKWLEVHGLEHWTEFYTDYGIDLQRRFFDHFLKGVDNGWDRSPRVQLKIRTPNGFVRRDEHEWPLARTRWTRMYLDLETGTLAEAAPVGESRASFAARREVLHFRAAPLSEPLEITGPAALKVFAGSTTADADLFVTVHLYDPDGQEVLFTTAFEPRAPLTQGWLRMSHRSTDPSLSTPYRPWHPHEQLAPLEPSRTYEADVEIWATSIAAPAGYSLGISVSGRDYEHGLPGKHHVAYGRELLGSGPYWHEHPGDRDRPEYAGMTTLVSAPGSRPYLLLPVIPANGE